MKPSLKVAMALHSINKPASGSGRGKGRCAGTPVGVGLNGVVLMRSKNPRLWCSSEVP